MKYHCYIEHMESVYSADVEAETPEGAAVIAATKEGIAGAWTIVPGEPVTVTVRESRTYVTSKFKPLA